MASVVVVGGGIAGLTCAWRLRRAGHDVEVLESEPEPGGRLRSEIRRGFVLEHGGRVVATSDHNLQRVVSVLGLEGELRPIPGPRCGVLRDWELHPADLARPIGLALSRLLSARARLRLPALAFARLRQRGRREPSRPELDPGLDGESAAAAARRLLGEEGAEYLLAPLLAALLGSDAEEISWAAALAGLERLAGPARWQSFAGGAGVLARSLAREVPVRLGCEAVAVESETGGARVRYRAGGSGQERSVIADAAVLAVPGCDAARVCPKLTPAERGFLEQVHYTRGISVHLLFDAAPPGIGFACVGFPRLEGIPLSSLGVEHHKAGAAPPGAGLLCARLSGAAAERGWDAPDAELAGRVADGLSRTPIGRLRPDEAVVRRWPGLLPRFEPGYAARLARFHERIDRSPRLAFAGDYLEGPTAEAAVTSGMRAATEIERGL